MKSFIDLLLIALFSAFSGVTGAGTAWYKTGFDDSAWPNAVYVDPNKKQNAALVHPHDIIGENGVILQFVGTRVY